MKNEITRSVSTKKISFGYKLESQAGTLIFGFTFKGTDTIEPRFIEESTYSANHHSLLKAEVYIQKGHNKRTILKRDPENFEDEKASILPITGADITLFEEMKKIITHEKAMANPIERKGWQWADDFLEKINSLCTSKDKKKKTHKEPAPQNVKGTIN